MKNNEWLIWFQILCSSLSIIGPMFIMIIYATMKNKYRNFALQLVVLISISDMVLGISDILRDSAKVNHIILYMKICNALDISMK